MAIRATAFASHARTSPAMIASRRARKARVPIVSTGTITGSWLASTTRDHGRHQPYAAH